MSSEHRESLYQHEARWAAVPRPPVSVSPHEFQPIRPWDRRDGGRCRACMLRRDNHPAQFWPPARAIGDKSPAASEEAQGGC